MTNKEYQDQVEKKLGKPLKDIMYELIVEKGMDQWDGSSELGVPKKTFVTWRTKYGLGPIQRSADLAQKIRQKDLENYRVELDDVDLERKFIYKDEYSIRGFKEIIERMLELEKQRRLLIESNLMNDFSISIKIGMLEQYITYLEQYEQSELYVHYESELKNLKMI